jgi:hypothetical protein
VLAQVSKAAAAAWHRRGRTAGGRWRGARLGKEIKEGGGCFLTARGSLGGGENGGEVDGCEDRHRRSSFKVGGGGLDWGAREPARGVGKLGVSEGRCEKALGALI